MEQDKELVLWVDGQIRIKSKEINELVLGYGSDGSFWAYKHAQSFTVWEEIQNCIDKGKAPEELLLKQYDSYKKDGFPDDLPLINGGVILRNIQDSAVIKFEEFWLEQIMKFSQRDEVSFPYVVWKTGFEYGIFTEGTIFDNLFFEVNREN